MAQEKEQAKLGLITYGGDIEGGGLAQFAYHGVKRVAEDRDLSVVVVDTDDAEKVELEIKQLLKSDLEAVVTTSLHTGQIIETFVKNYPQITFVTINYQPQVDLPNITGLPVELHDIEELEQTLAAHLSIQLEAGERGFLQNLRLSLLEWNIQGVLIPFLAIFTALIVGALFIAGFDPLVWAAFREGIRPGLQASGQSVINAYSALWNGSIGNPQDIVGAFRTWIESGETEQFVSAFSPVMESLRISTPYIFTGLSVALGFRAGLFNIGAEGQYFIGGLTSVFIGYSVQGLPWYLHLPLAVAAGFLGGAIWAGISGFLKAETGAHEVITTIMLNYIAYNLAEYLLQVGGPMARPDDPRPISPPVLESARLQQFFPDNPAIRINVGLFFAFFMVFVVWYILFKTPIGFELRTVGSSPRAAKTAGMSIGWNYILAMGLSGGLAGLAGGHDVLGVLGYMPNSFRSGYGFDAIALALLGKSHPVGVLMASLLFGVLRAGAVQMQGAANVPVDIISVLQGLIIVFIAAPEMIRALYRLRDTGEEGETVLTTGWGGTE